MIKLINLTLTEKLEEVADGTYATDSAGDIANWLLNKPKPYRIIYDTKFDIWIIGDAMQTIHRAMAQDMIDSETNFRYDYISDDDIEELRRIAGFNDGYTESEVYVDYGFSPNSKMLIGAFFIPNGDSYEKYEQSGFYKYAYKIKSGTIFTAFPNVFSRSGAYASLYRKLYIQNAILPGGEYMPIENICDVVKKQHGRTEDAFRRFQKIAKHYGYSEEESEQYASDFGL